MKRIVFATIFHTTNSQSEKQCNKIKISPKESNSKSDHKNKEIIKLIPF
jgi:hypothetical protein